MRQYSTTAALAERARALHRPNLRRKRLTEGQIQAGKRKILFSPQFQGLSEANKLIVRKALKGADVAKDVRLESPARTVTAAEKILLSNQAGGLMPSRIVSLVLQLPARRQKTVLFSMPGQSDAVKEKAWGKVQAIRSEQHVGRVKKTLQRILKRGISKPKRLQSIASQLMTVSPGLRQKLLASISLSFTDTKQVRAIIAAKNREIRNRISGQRGIITDEHGFEVENPMLSLPLDLRPAYRALAKARRARGEEMLYPAEFLDLLREEAHRRGVTMKELFKR